MTITAQTKLAGVMGWPIEHSLSPILHKFWLDKYGIDGAVVPLAVRPENLDIALKSLPALGFLGTWITLPHKETACDIVDELDDAAQKIGAINTVHVRSDGQLQGSNTDYFGFIENLKAQQPDMNFEGLTVFLIGAGGSARAVLYGLLQEKVSRVIIFNRTEARAQRLAEDFQTALTAISVVSQADISEGLRGADLIVNTTSVGMENKSLKNDLPIDIRTARPDACVADIIYNPLKTDFLSTAEALGLRIVTGLGMLIHQGRPGFKKFFGEDVDMVPELERLLLKTLEAPL